MSTVRVDSDELASLGDGLAAIQSHLDSVEDSRGNHAAFGDDLELADRVDGFIGDWSDGRKRISENIAALAAGMANAALSYRACDEEVRAAAGRN